jgi:hypothetical protein
METKANPALRRSVLFLLFAFGSASAIVVCDSKRMPLISQAMERWCWAAADHMVLEFIGVISSPSQGQGTSGTPMDWQCQVAQVAADLGQCGLAGQDCCGNPESCNVPCESQIGDIIPWSSSSRQSLSWDNIRTQVEQCFGLIYAFKFFPEEDSHFRVVRGYFITAPVRWGVSRPLRWILANDPSPLVDSVLVPYNEYVRNSVKTWHSIR